jgi:hypothetical protein
VAHSAPLRAVGWGYPILETHHSWRHAPLDSDYEFRPINLIEIGAAGFAAVDAGSVAGDENDDPDSRPRRLEVNTQAAGSANRSATWRCCCATPRTLAQVCREGGAA